MKSTVSIFALVALTMCLPSFSAMADSGLKGIQKSLSGQMETGRVQKKHRDVPIPADRPSSASIRSSKTAAIVLRHNSKNITGNAVSYEEIDATIKELTLLLRDGIFLNEESGRSSAHSAGLADTNFDELLIKDLGRNCILFSGVSFCENENKQTTVTARANLELIASLGNKREKLKQTIVKLNRFRTSSLLNDFEAVEVTAFLHHRDHIELYSIIKTVNWGIKQPKRKIVRDLPQPLMDKSVDSGMMLNNPVKLPIEEDSKDK